MNGCPGGHPANVQRLLLMLLVAVGNGCGDGSVSLTRTWASTTLPLESNSALNRPVPTATAVESKLTTVCSTMNIAAMTSAARVRRRIDIWSQMKVAAGLVGLWKLV